MVLNPETDDSNTRTAGPTELQQLVAQVTRDQRTVRSLIRLIRGQDCAAAAVSLATKLSLTAAKELAAAGCLTACLSHLRPDSPAAADAAVLVGHMLPPAGLEVTRAERRQLLDALCRLLAAGPLDERTERSAVWLTGSVCECLSSSASGAHDEPDDSDDEKQQTTQVAREAARRLDSRDEATVCDAVRGLCALLAAGERAVSGAAADVVAVRHAAQTVRLLALGQSAGRLRAGLRLAGAGTAAGTEAQVRALLDAGLLPACVALLHDSASADVRRDVCWVAANCAAGSGQQIGRLAESGLLALVLRQLSRPQDEDWGVRREAAFCAAHVAQCGERPQLTCLLADDPDVVPALVRCLRLADARLLRALLSALSRLLACDRLSLATAAVQRAGGRHCIQLLAHHADQRVAQAAYALSRQLAQPAPVPPAAHWFVSRAQRRPFSDR